MRKRIARALCVVLVLGSLAGCGSKESDADINASKSGEGDVAGQLTSASTLENASYVMIYNPYVYDESGEYNVPEPAAMNTGDFASQIVVGMNRAGELDTGIEVPQTWSQKEINKDVDTSGVNREGVRAEAMDPSYKKGEKHDFFHMDEFMTSTMKDTFTCEYVGENCYIWSLNGSIDAKTAEEMGKEFDTNIYAKDVETFGPARFTENGGKVNLLFYPLQEGYGGFFTTADIFSSAEVPAETAEMYGLNTDHAIVHINSLYLTENPDFAKSTMAHELQHQICASASFNYYESPMMKTWINEAMSAYAEEIVYPGIKEAGYYNYFFYLSNNFRTGQSLYNFDIEMDEYIGAYGTVYLFSQYMEDKAGADVFSKVHSYWRDSYSATVTEAEALANAVPEAVRDEIDQTYVYPESISSGFENEYEEWMSKLTLDFFIETLSPELANLAEATDQAHAAMLYSEVSPVDIEGGGRIIIATQNETYEIPEGADPNLIYVGLDKNFEPVDIYTAK